MRTDQTAMNGDVRLHCIRFGTQSPGDCPLVVIPGMGEYAEDYTDHLKDVDDAIIVSLRGRGRSDTPLNGYSFEEQLSDISTVLSQLEVGRCIILGVSMGVAFALATAFRHSDNVAGLILVDYPPMYPKISEGWAEDIIQSGFYDLSERAARGIEAESEQTFLSQQLSRIECPTLVIRGAQEGSLLREDVAMNIYKRRIPKCEVVVLEEMSHDPFEKTKEQMADQVQRFMGAVSANGSG